GARRDDRGPAALGTARRGAGAGAERRGRSPWGILARADHRRPQRWRAGGGGKLLLIYPNIIAVERQLRLLPRDFRLWVCLHEVTHRVQFTANPWLAGYMSSALGVITEEAGEDFGRVMGRLAGYVRERRDGTGA